MMRVYKYICMHGVCPPYVGVSTKGTYCHLGYLGTNSMYYECCSALFCKAKRVSSKANENN